MRTSRKHMRFLPSQTHQQHKQDLTVFLLFPLSLSLNPLLHSPAAAALAIHQTQRKISSIAELASTELSFLYTLSSTKRPTPPLVQRLSIVFERRSLHPEASPTRSQTAILHKRITDPSHNSEPPYRLLPHLVQSPCRSLDAAPPSRSSNAPHAEVKSGQPPLRNKTAQLANNLTSLISGRS
jgi:hypothetical protein